MAKRSQKNAAAVLQDARDALVWSYQEMWALDQCARAFPETRVSVINQRIVLKMLAKELILQWGKAKRLLELAPVTSARAALHYIEKALTPLRLLADDVLNDDAGGSEYDPERIRIECALALGLFTAAASAVNEAMWCVDGDYHEAWAPEFWPGEESVLKKAA